MAVAEERIITLKLSRRWKVEMKKLKAISGLREPELIRVALSIFRLHVEAASDGNTITINPKKKGGEKQKQEIILPFELQGKYTCEEVPDC